MTKNLTVFESLIESASIVAKATGADAVIFLLDTDVRWELLSRSFSRTRVIIASHSKELLAQAAEAGLDTVHFDIHEASIQDRLTQSILDSIASEFVMAGSSVVAVYSNFDTDELDTLSVIKLNERLGRLTARDLQKLETNVPLETLKAVVDLACQIGREGREGKPVGTMFVVGDHRKVLEHSRPSGFDPVKGYTRKERNILDKGVREGIKEIAQMDGCFVVASDGTVESACRIIDTNPVDITMTTGLGSRHYYGAAISKNSKAIAIAVSETSGTVRIFQDGEIVLRIEPLQRAMKWKIGGPNWERSTDIERDGP
ncbi:MAG TPA: diadenylate cyclase [Pirellulaceae bacterium]|nr:diadenylate cyclase [Pirellulaceae bacterium]HMO93524.1 diadenylate cyclase [Pirellulaceae bacterium]HMP70364.1 diadenylate cyclase [Pirellulaceae bacterium]